MKYAGAYSFDDGGYAFYLSDDLFKNTPTPVFTVPSPGGNCINYPTFSSIETNGALVEPSGTVAYFTLVDPPSATKVPGPYATPRDDYDPMFSPSGDWLMFLDKTDAWVSHIVGGVPKTASRLNTVLPNAGVDRVEFAKFAPSSRAALYLAAQETSGKLEVYSANLTDPGNWRKLSGTLGTGGAVPKTPFPRWAADSSRVAYIAEQSKSGTSAPGPGLYLVDMLQGNATGKKIGSSSCTRPNTGAAWTCQGVTSFDFSP